MMIPTLKNRPLVVPAPQAAPILEVGIFPHARTDGRHVPRAQARGGKAQYGDLHGFVWYTAGGMLTLNRGGKRLRRTHRGAEDGSHTQG